MVIDVLVFVGVVGLPAATAAVLYNGALAVGLGRRTAVRVAATTGGGWAAWIVVSGLLGAAGAYRQEADAAQPWIGVAFAGALVVALLATRVPVVSRILADPATPARLAVPQVLRVVGVVFLIALAQGTLPAIFALPAGLGDLAIGVSALVVARRLASGAGGSRRGAVWFNVLGIVDLVVAVGIGFMAGLGPLNVLDVTPSTAPLGLLPLVLIPTTAVPLAVALHVVSLRQLAVRRPVPVTAAA